MTASAQTDTRYSTVEAALSSLAQRDESTMQPETDPMAHPPGYFTNLAARKAAEDAERYRSESGA